MFVDDTLGTFNLPRMRHYSVYDLFVGVSEVPVIAGIHNCSSTSSMLTYLLDLASKINLRQLHQFSSCGMENLEYSESVEKLLTLNDKYL